ncbi:hypothetical protein [Plasmodium yoelii yoelii]|uniref:Uncharacterized protein n=1 Tax=Plasmodium yoelii yoelii TaxID=73239 RepID=Q7R7U9_PLAYO|nr:hypothetical protein [Plasmodium yoelii yoelii]
MNASVIDFRNLFASILITLVQVFDISVCVNTNPLATEPAPKKNTKLKSKKNTESKSKKNKEPKPEKLCPT